MTLAPIILFTYNRPEHTCITLEYLSKCDLASDSVLYVFCDGPKPDSSAENLINISKVYDVILKCKWPKELIVLKSDVNLGLFKNVTRGVSQVIEKHNKCIVLEDDLKIGTDFLKYMNQSLDLYDNASDVKQISGFVFPAFLRSNHSAFFLPVTNTIGWGTWKRAWNEVDFNANGYMNLLTDKSLAYRFNLNGTYNYSKMLIKQIKNQHYGSWGVIYWWSVFRNNGLVLYPDYSLIQHNDFDYSGIHASDDSHYNYDEWDEHYKILTFPKDIKFTELDVFEKICIHLKSRKVYSFKNILIKIKTKFISLNMRK